MDLFDPSSPPRQEAPEATVNEETTSSIDKSAVAQIQEILHDIQMDVDKSPVHGSTKKVEALPNKEKDLQKTLSPSNHANVPNERSPRFIRIASPSRRDLIENQEELNKKNDNSFRELDPLESQNSSTITSPEGASSSEAHAMPDDNRSNQNQNPPSNITEVVNKTSVPSFENNAGPCERVVINFIHKSRLVPKQKKVVVHQRNVIRFVKKGKLDCRLIQQNIETHECPVVEKKSCLSKETQTESFTFRDAIVQTEELEELRVVDKTEMEIQTDNELWNSFLKEMSGVFAMEASRDAGNGSQRSREATPDVFQSVEPLEAFDRALEVCQRDVSPDVFQNVEPFKRARVPSEGNSGDENEPKRKRASFDIQQPEFQVPVASASRAPSVEEAASKTVIMESDQESDSVDVVAPTPPRKQPTPKLPPPPPKRVFTCSSLQVTVLTLN